MPLHFSPDLAYGPYAAARPGCPPSLGKIAAIHRADSLRMNDIAGETSWRPRFNRLCSSLKERETGIRLFREMRP